MSPSFLMIEVCIMIEMTLTAFKLGMGDDFWTKKEVFPLKNTSVYSIKNNDINS